MKAVRMYQYQSRKRPLQLGDRRVWVDVEFGLEPEGQRLLESGEIVPCARFVVTGTVWKHEHAGPEQWESRGQCMPEIRMAFPELRTLLRWNHAVDGRPPHYFDFAFHWYGVARSEQTLRPDDIDPRERFAQAIVLGALEDDPSLSALLDLQWPDCLTVLNERQTRLREAFERDMAELPKIAERLR